MDTEKQIEMGKDECFKSQCQDSMKWETLKGGKGHSRMFLAFDLMWNTGLRSTG